MEEDLRAVHTRGVLVEYHDQRYKLYQIHGLGDNMHTMIPRLLDKLMKMYPNDKVSLEVVFYFNGKDRGVSFWVVTPDIEHEFMTRDELEFYVNDLEQINFISKNINKLYEKNLTVDTLLEDGGL
jgi:hypothetical protein